MDVMSLCEELLVSFPFLVPLFPHHHPPPSTWVLSVSCMKTRHKLHSLYFFPFFLLCSTSSIVHAIMQVFISFHVRSGILARLSEYPLPFAAARSFHLIPCIEVLQKPLCTNWKVFILLSQFSRHPLQVLSDQRQQPSRSFSIFCNEICFHRQQQERETAELQLRWKALELFPLSHGLLALIVDGIWSWEEDSSWLILQRTPLVLSDCDTILY